MRLARLALLLLLCVAATPRAEAQRRARDSVLPIDAQLFTGSSAHEYRLSVSAREDVQLTADVRLLHLEVHAAGSRRALACDAPNRPRRADPDHVRSLRAGEVWTESFDIRTVCWGRALAALEAGAELRGTFGSARGRAGVPVARTDTREVRSAPLAPLTVAAAPAAPAPAGDVRVALAPTDAVSGAHVSFRVSVRASRAVRGWVRPDRVRFRVVAPDGTTHTCQIPRGEGAPIPDLFARISPRSGPVLALDARAYCGARAFAAAGIYEVTPLLDLDEDGSSWRYDAPLGTFEGATVPLRVRSDMAGGS